MTFEHMLKLSASHPCIKNANHKGGANKEIVWPEINKDFPRKSTVVREMIHIMHCPWMMMQMYGG